MRLCRTAADSNPWYWGVIGGEFRRPSGMAGQRGTVGRLPERVATELVRHGWTTEKATTAVNPALPSMGPGKRNQLCTHLSPFVDG